VYACKNAFLVDQASMADASNLRNYRKLRKQVNGWLTSDVDLTHAEQYEVATLMET
jgi:hypothetical protein